MITTVLIDDEHESLDGLASLLSLFCPTIKITGTANNIAQGIKVIRAQKPQLVFLDVEMPGGTGFDILEQVTGLKFAVIFTTAFDHYAIKAIRMSALDYLLKPIDPDELIAAVEKAKDAIQKNIFPQGQDMIDGHKFWQLHKIAVPGPEGTEYILLQDIIRLEASNNYTFLYAANKKPILISKTIKSFEGTLPGEQFLRCHQSHIVNIFHVKKFVRTENRSYLVIGADNIPVSRSFKPVVVEKLNNLFTP